MYVSALAFAVSVKPQQKAVQTTLQAKSVEKKVDVDPAFGNKLKAIQNGMEGDAKAAEGTPAEAAAADQQAEANAVKANAQGAAAGAAAAQGTQKAIDQAASAEKQAAADASKAAADKAAAEQAAADGAAAEQAAAAKQAAQPAPAAAPKTAPAGGLTEGESKVTPKLQTDEEFNDDFARDEQDLSPHKGSACGMTMSMGVLASLIFLF